MTGLFQGFPITGSQARTTINDTAGGKTQVASLVAALTLILFLLFLTPLIARLPTVALAALLIYGGFTLVEFGVMVRIYRFYPQSAMLAALTTLGVLAVGVVPGILVGVAFSLLALISRISNPPDAVLREVPGGVFHDLGDTADGQTIPGFIAYRFYAPLLFSNCGHFAERVRALIAASPTPVRWLVIDAQAITDIDVTAAEALQALKAELDKEGIAMKFAHANRPLREILQRIGFTSELGQESFFSSGGAICAGVLRPAPPHCRPGRPLRGLHSPAIDFRRRRLESFTEIRAGCGAHGLEHFAAPGKGPSNHGASRRISTLHQWRVRSGKELTEQMSGVIEEELSSDSPAARWSLPRVWARGLSSSAPARGAGRIIPTAGRRHDQFCRSWGPTAGRGRASGPRGLKTAFHSSPLLAGPGKAVGGSEEVFEANLLAHGQDDVALGVTLARPLVAERVCVGVVVRIRMLFTSSKRRKSTGSGRRTMRH